MARGSAPADCWHAAQELGAGGFAAQELRARRWMGGWHAALELGHAALGLGARGVWMLDGWHVAQEVGPAVLDGWHAAQELGARGVWMPAQELGARRWMGLRGPVQFGWGPDGWHAALEGAEFGFWSRPGETASLKMLM